VGRDGRVLMAVPSVCSHTRYVGFVINESLCAHLSLLSFPKGAFGAIAWCFESCKYHVRVRPSQPFFCQACASIK